MGVRRGRSKRPLHKNKVETIQIGVESGVMKDAEYNSIFQRLGVRLEEGKTNFRVEISSKLCTDVMIQEQTLRGKTPLELLGMGLDEVAF